MLRQYITLKLEAELHSREVRVNPATEMVENAE